MNDKLNDKLIELAKAAQKLNKQKGITAENIHEVLTEGIRKIPDQLQMMIDSFVSMQKDFPMPQKNWKLFVRDLEYTNRKHGLKLVIKPELLEGPSAYETYAKSVNKAIEELSDEDKRKALFDQIIGSEIN